MGIYSLKKTSSFLKSLPGGGVDLATTIPAVGASLMGAPTAGIYPLDLGATTESVELAVAALLPGCTLTEA